MLDEDLLRTQLAKLPLGTPLHLVRSTGSTNEDALVWAEDGAPEGALVVADHQTRGRGRHGRQWLSEPGRALLFSAVLRPPPERAALLSTVAGVAVCEAIRARTRLSALLKWPNDVVVDERKLAGILVESRFSTGSPPVAVVGVGINVSWGAELLPAAIAERATSIATEMGRQRLGEAPAREALLAAVIEHLGARYSQLRSGEPDGLITLAESLSSLVGREVVVRLPNGGAATGTVTGLDPQGRLELETDAGYKVLDAGEIETVRPA